MKIVLAIAIGILLIVFFLVGVLICFTGGDVFDDGIGYLFGDEEKDDETGAIEVKDK